jgi:hypothetical protein
MHRTPCAIRLMVGTRRPASPSTFTRSFCQPVCAASLVMRPAGAEFWFRQTIAPTLTVH